MIHSGKGRGGIGEGGNEREGKVGVYDGCMDACFGYGVAGSW